ncbi:hypothetical protein HDU86_003544 [Geranomyces michiganensis]|nr:hypothetical protein HDU86_003544 [Geranomyces michiganensis]
MVNPESVPVQYPTPHIPTAESQRATSLPHYSLSSPTTPRYHGLPASNQPHPMGPLPPHTTTASPSCSSFSPFYYPFNPYHPALDVTCISVDGIAIGPWHRLALSATTDLYTEVDLFQAVIRTTFIEESCQMRITSRFQTICSMRLDTMSQTHSGGNDDDDEPIAELTIEYCAPPVFELLTPTGTWVPCHDFTECGQASQCRIMELAPEFVPCPTAAASLFRQPTFSSYHKVERRQMNEKEPIKKNDEYEQHGIALVSSAMKDISDRIAKQVVKETYKMTVIIKQDQYELSAKRIKAELERVLKAAGWRVQSLAVVKRGPLERFSPVVEIAVTLSWPNEFKAQINDFVNNACNQQVRRTHSRWGVPDILIDNASVYRYGPPSPPVFTNLTWHVLRHQRWAVIGPVGSGKTSLCELLLGRHRPDPTDSISYPFIASLARAGASVWPQDVIKHVSFKESSGLFDYSRHYYQQRFEWVEEHEDISLRKYIESAVYNHRADGSATGDGPVSSGIYDAVVREMADRVGLGSMLDLSFMKLSNGQVRRARIARALLSEPSFLLVDEPFMGLDVQSRREVAELLGRLAESKPSTPGGIVSEYRATRVIVTLRPQDEVPDWVTHVLELDRGRKVVFDGPANLWREQRHQPAVHPGFRPPSANEYESDKSGSVVELKNVSVGFDGAVILKNVSWRVRRGERWALMGRNGSGKSTLLSLLLGDNPQAYSNDITLFGRQRGSGETIWEVKSRTGFSSPELHMYLSRPLTATEVIATGFHDVPAFNEPITPAHHGKIRSLLAEFGLTDLAHRRFGQLSTGEQRLLLFLRAVVKQPPLLVLDEPFQGLDEDTVERAKKWLDTRLEPDQTLIFVTHCTEELPTTVDRLIRLEKGQVVELV